MKFTTVDLKHIAQVLFNIYTLSKKKKLTNVPDTFEEFIIQNIHDGLCPPSCMDHINNE